MDPHNPGVAHLYAPARLKNLRITEGRNRSVMYDAIIRRTREIDGSFLLCCSLRYSLRKLESPLPSSCYNVEAIVYQTVIKFYDYLTSLLTLQVVSFRPHTHLISPTRPDSNFQLMGEITKVHLYQNFRMYLM